MIAFSIYTINKKNSLTFEILILASIVFVLYQLFPSINIGFLLIPIVAFILYKASKNDKNEVIGKIYLTNHQIRVETKSNTFQVDLHSIDKFEMTYSGYSGQRLQGDFIGPFNTFSGSDNFIILVRNNEEFKCRFLVENAQQENELLTLIKNWEAFGYDIRNIRINK